MSLGPNEPLLEAEKTRAKLDKELLAAQAQADVSRNQSVQPQLVEAITALGDKQFLSSAAENMNLVSLLKGQDAVSLLGNVLGNTRIAKTVKKMRDFAAMPVSDEN